MPEPRPVRHVAGGEQQRCGLSRKCRESGFQLLVRRAVPAHQVRSPRSHAILHSALLHGRDEFGMVGKTQVIIAAKRKISLAVDNDVRRLRALQHAPLAQQSQCGALIKFVL